MKQSEESAAVEKNQAQLRQQRKDFFGHRKRSYKQPGKTSALMLRKIQEESRMLALCTGLEAALRKRSGGAFSAMTVDELCAAKGETLIFLY